MPAIDENVIKRIMPHSLEAEQSVIGSMFIDTEAIAAATEQISGEDFYNRQYGIVFDTIVELNNEGKPVDFVTLQDRLRSREDVPPEVSGLDFLTNLIASVPTSANIKYYAGIVAEKATLRRLIRTNEEIAKKMNMPVAKIDEILKTSRDPVSLDTPIGEEEDSQLGDFIEDESLLSPVDSASFSMLKEELEEAMASLTERERNVIKLRFGLDDGKTRTLEEVGKEFNVTRERIRQIEAKALRKLRHPSRSRKLKDFLE